jgi:hypothetical protein
VPAVPFTSGVSGSQSQSGPDTQGNIRITLAMHLTDTASTPLTVVLVGAQSGGGVSLTSGTVDFAGDSGTVVGLNGGTVVATVATPSPITLTMQLQVGQQSGALSGTVTGSARARR